MEFVLLLIGCSIFIYTDEEFTKMLRITEHVPGLLPPRIAPIWIESYICVDDSWLNPNPMENIDDKQNILVPKKSYLYPSVISDFNRLKEKYKLAQNYRKQVYKF